MNQDDLNREMMEGGIARYRGKVQSARERGAETDASYGARLLRGTVPRLIEDIERAITYHRTNQQSVPPWMPNIWDYPIDTITFIALKSVLDSISVRKSLMKSAMSIANLIQDECRYRWMQDNYPDVFKHADKDVKRNRKAGHGYRRNWQTYLRHEHGEVSKGNIKGWTNWDRKSKVLMGTWFLEMIRKSTHLVRFVKAVEVHKTKFYIQPTEELFTWIDEYNESQEFLFPLWMPMIQKPHEWTGVWSGGYTSHRKVERIPPQSIIKTYDMEYLRSLDIDTMKDVVDSLNHIQSTPFKVNTRVLDVMEQFWSNNHLVGDMPQRENYPIPKFPDSDDPERKQEWKRQAARIHDRNISLQSQRLQVVKTLALANKFKDEPKIYFPSQLDFRGRVYPIPHFLTPQGTDIGKSLLLFAKPETIWNVDDARWLAIHGANCWGVDKLTLDERVEWVNKQRQEIQKVFDDPHTNKWWTEADEPWQFLAFCFEWGGLLKAGGQGYKTYLPCQMDASNNGIQILSMLARDSVGALATNVLPTETPADLYQDVADVVRKKLEDDGSPLARAWLDFGIDRKTCKRPVMVKPYGGTRYSCRAYIDEWYNDKIIKENVPDPFSGERFAACQFLSTKVWDAMNEILDKPDEVMKWLQKNVRALNVEGKHAEWTSPSGLRVKQHYRGGTRHAVKTVLTEAVVAISYNEDAPTLDKTRQANGISPNFVHSIDAAAVHLTANKCKEFGIHSLSMVHDSFGTHSPSCQRLGDILRYVFVKIFEKDLLTDFQNSLKSLSNTLPSEFKLGDLQVEEVLESKYFFS